MSESPDAKARRQMRAAGWNHGHTPRRYHRPHTQSVARAQRARELGGVALFRETMNQFFRVTRR